MPETEGTIYIYVPFILVCIQNILNITSITEYCTFIRAENIDDESGQDDDFDANAELDSNRPSS